MCFWQRKYSERGLW